MTPKQIALRNTLIAVAYGIAGGALVSIAFTFLTVAQMGIAACVILLGAGIKFIYDIELHRAETLAELNKNR